MSVTSLCQCLTELPGAALDLVIHRGTAVYGTELASQGMAYGYHHPGTLAVKAAKGNHLSFLLCHIHMIMGAPALGGKMGQLIFLLRLVKSAHPAHRHSVVDFQYIVVKYLAGLCQKLGHSQLFQGPASGKHQYRIAHEHALAGQVHHHHHGHPYSQIFLTG